MGTNQIIRDAARIINELFSFEGEVEELCAMSEMEGEFGMPAVEMIDDLRIFAECFSGEN